MATKGGKVGVWPLLLFWALTVALYALKAWATAATTPLILDADDAMRLTEVHDFLNGQGWFDLIQHRLDTPYGASMHWSRLIDLPEAALLFLLRPFAGASADTIAAYVWPSLLLLPLLWLTAQLALRLGRREALWAALILPGLSLITLGEFAPGRFDHHSAQILLSLAILYCTLLALQRPRFTIGAAIAAAAALAIGIEGLPIVAATVMVFTLMWVASPTHRTALHDFGLSFACAMALGLALGVAPADWFALRLDAISIVYVAAAVLCGAAFAGLSLLKLKTVPLRLLAAVIAGVIVGALLLWVDPALPRGPYAALDPWLVTNWMSRIAEAETWLQSFADDPVYPLAVTVPVLVALAFAIWNIVRHKSERGAWAIVAAFLVVGLLVMLVQIRAARIVTPLAVPATAALVATVWRRLVARPGIGSAFTAVGCMVISSGLAVAVLVALLPLPPPAPGPARGDRQLCLQPAAFTALAKMPPQRIMASIDLGAHLLLFTAHSVVGAPYHRNQQGLLDTFRFFNGPIAEARTILETRGINLVVTCDNLTEVHGLPDRAADSFAALNDAKALPGWLVEQTPPDSVLRVFAVQPR